MRRLKNNAGPTWIAASMITSARVLSGAARSSRLCAFSIMTMAASTIAPMAIAIPPRLMMFELSPSTYMQRYAINIPSGSVMMATNAQQEHDADEGDDDALFDQRSLEGLDGAVD